MRTRASATCRGWRTTLACWCCRGFVCRTWSATCSAGSRSESLWTGIGSTVMGSTRWKPSWTARDSQAPATGRPTGVGLGRPRAAPATTCSIAVRLPAPRTFMSTPWRRVFAGRFARPRPQHLPRCFGDEALYREAAQGPRSGRRAGHRRSASGSYRRRRGRGGCAVARPHCGARRTDRSAQEEFIELLEAPVERHRQAAEEDPRAQERKTTQRGSKGAPTIRTDGFHRGAARLPGHLRTRCGSQGVGAAG